MPQYVSQLNGYLVKDKEARTMLEEAGAMLEEKAEKTQIDELNNKLLYSNEEIVVGKWKDSSGIEKNVYRKVIVATGTTNSNAINSGINYNDLDIMLKMEASVSCSLGMVNGSFYTSENDTFRYWLSTNGEIKFINGSMIATPYTVTFILEYTKK